MRNWQNKRKNKWLKPTNKSKNTKGLKRYQQTEGKEGSPALCAEDTDKQKKRGGNPALHAEDTDKERESEGSPVQRMVTVTLLTK